MLAIHFYLIKDAYLAADYSYLNLPKLKDGL
jgi:hypothetical protein